MSKVDLEEIFFDFFDVTKQYIPESDHVTMCMDILRTLEDYGYNLNTLKGHDKIVDEALEELYPDMSDVYDIDELDEEY